jgi:hypothetical protein
MLSYEQAIAQPLGPLEWEAVSKLFRWPVALLYGANERAVLTAVKPQELKEPNDWSYPQRRDDAKPSYPDRSMSGHPEVVSKLSAWERREQLGLTAKQDRKAGDDSRYDSNPSGFEASLSNPEDDASFARPGAIALEMQQQFPSTNPYLKDHRLPPFEPALPSESEMMAGAWWLFQSVGQETIRFVPMTLDILIILGIEAGGQSVAAQLFHHAPRSRVAAVIRNWTDIEEPSARLAVKNKLDRLMAIALRVEEFWEVPFMSLDGSVDRAVTLSNMATVRLIRTLIMKEYSELNGFIKGIGEGLIAILGAASSP